MKKLKKLAGILLASLLLSGCTKIEIGYVVKSESEIGMEATMLFSPELSKNMEENEEDITTSIDEETYENIKVKEVEKEIDGEIWKGINATGDLKEADVKKYLKVSGNELVFTFPVEELQNSTPSSSMGDSFDENSMTIEGEGMDELGEAITNAYTASGMEMKFKVTMPKTPTTNIGTVEGNTVVIDLMSEEYTKFAGENIVVRCQNSIDFMKYIPIACVAFISIFCIVGIILVNKNEE